MFARRYEQVQAESMQIWRLQYYAVLQEYRARPNLPSPLSVLELGAAVLVGACQRSATHGLHALAQHHYRRRHENLHPERLEHFQERQTERSVANRTVIRLYVACLCRRDLSTTLDMA